MLISLSSKRSAIRRREASPRSRDRNARSGRNKADKFRSLNWLKDDSFRGANAPASLELRRRFEGAFGRPGLPGRSRPGLIGACRIGRGEEVPVQLPGRSRPGLIGARTSCSPRRPPGTGFRGVRAPASLEPGHLQRDGDAVHRFRGVRAPASLEHPRRRDCRRPLGHRFRGVRAPASLERRMGCQRASNYFRASGAFAPRPHWSTSSRCSLERVQLRFRGVRAPASLEHEAPQQALALVGEASEAFAPWPARG